MTDAGEVLDQESCEKLFYLQATTTDLQASPPMELQANAQRQAASRYLHDLADIGVMRPMPFGKEKLFIHPKLMQVLNRDANQFQPYA